MFKLTLRESKGNYFSYYFSTYEAARNSMGVSFTFSQLTINDIPDVVPFTLIFDVSFSVSS
jgi:hypothetical protein